MYADGDVCRCVNMFQMNIESICDQITTGSSSDPENDCSLVGVVVKQMEAVQPIEKLENAWDEKFATRNGLIDAKSLGYIENLPYD